MGSQISLAYSRVVAAVAEENQVPLPVHRDG
jgi:hypothetical protein